jgi:L-fuculose-phosphate aldolase
MNFSMLPPRAQLVEMLTRIYHQGLTTTSGGNLSILDDNGDLWITPAGVDKGTLTAEDIVCVHADGRIEGRHRPSTEYPFHRMIYSARPDLRALVHAHPPALVSFSIVRKLPDTSINPQSRDICGRVGYAAYATPGSEQLGENIASAFSEGFNCVMLENHGVVTGGHDLVDAFQRFETLEFCAQINLHASSLGSFRTLNKQEIDLFYARDMHLNEFDVQHHSSQELELRQNICEFVHRAYLRRLMISTGGTVSARVGNDRFLVTPYGVDRKYLQPEDIVLIADGKREAGKQPSRAVALHRAIYAEHPEINCVMTTQSPYATTYAISSRGFNTRLIPESYIVLRDMPIIPYGLHYTDPSAVARKLSYEVPIVLLQNDAVLATGSTILQAFDRVEVAEFSAQALISSLYIGELIPIEEHEIDDLKRKFLS